jgi:pimeloyl-ACP methyl ester carboxylesterase
MKKTIKIRGWRYWRNIVIAVLAILLIGLLSVFYIALPITYANGVARPHRAPVCCTTPGDLGLEYKNVSFTTNDGLTLYGWYIPSQNRAVVIISHGIGGNRLGHLEQGAFLAEHGFGVLLLDLRAHGESDGDLVSFGGNDIIAALDYLKSRDDIDPNRIGAMGVSLGGLVTIQAAATSTDIKAVVADGSAANAIQDLPRPVTLGHWLDLPFQCVTLLVWQHQGVSAPLSTVDAIERISPRPVLLISGMQSEYEQALQRKLFAAAGEPKTLWEVPEAGHAASWSTNPDEYQEKILSLFNQALLADE